MSIQAAITCRGKTLFLFFKKGLYQLVFGVVSGVLCGVVGTGVSYSLSFVTRLRGSNYWLIFCLPFFGLVSVFVDRLCRLSGWGTNQLLESIHRKKGIPVLLAPAVLLGTLLTHLGGGSAGREGAALQIGGSLSALTAAVFKPKEDTRHILTLCGMSALFSALFGTPLGACVFVLEIAQTGRLRLSALFPTLTAACTAYGISSLCGVKGERFFLGNIPAFSFGVLWRIALVAVVGAIVSFVFCHVMRYSKTFFRTVFRNEYLRIAVGGALITLR